MISKDYRNKLTYPFSVANFGSSLYRNVDLAFLLIKKNKYVYMNYFYFANMGNFETFSVIKNASYFFMY